MTAYQLIQRLAMFPPDTKVRNGVDWSDPILDDATDTTGEDGACVVLTTRYSSNGHEVVPGQIGHFVEDVHVNIPLTNIGMNS